MKKLKLSVIVIKSITGIKSCIKKNKILIRRISILLFSVGFLLVFAANLIVTHSTKNKLFDDLSIIPYNRVGLLLGTSKLRKNGEKNPYFYHRINAATELYNSKKISYIIASGDNRTIQNNEPLDMKKALMENGIPDSVIYLDCAGFRTFDSVIRSAKIFGQANFTIISQSFHNQRAVYIANYYNLNVVAYNAKDLSGIDGLKTMIREKLARVKMFIDLLIGKKPHFLGEKIEIQ